MNLRDGVKTADCKVSKEAYQLSNYVQDLDHSIIDRLESYEDILNLEIGDTGLNRAKNLERDFGLRQLFIKYEGDNPTGTQKDRIAFAQVYDAVRRQYDTVCLATCGNYGVAMALASQLAGVRCKIFIPENYHTGRTRDMVNLGAEIIRSTGDYEESVRMSSEAARENEWYDANPGGDNTPLQIAAYAQIAVEIYDNLRDAPKFVAVPVSNGTLLAGIYRGFVGLYKRGKTSRIPRMIAASSTNKNPIIASFKAGLEKCVDLDPTKMHETRINEPLINWHSFDGEEALYALKQSDGLAYYISDTKMKEMSSYLHHKEGLRILPASTSGLIAMLQLHETQHFDTDRFVAIITARH